MKTMKTILVIEDDPNIAELIKDRVECKGYQVFIAYTGNNAIEILNKESSLPDVITLDLYLPDISGIEILKLLKQNKQLYKIPVIVITSDNSKMEECNFYNSDAFLTKPINFKKFEYILENKICEKEHLKAG